MIEQENVSPESQGAAGDDVAVGFYDVDGPDSLLISIVETASTLTDGDGVHFPALEDSIDLESLQTVLRSIESNDSTARGFVEFDHDDLSIQVHVGGMIVVRREP